MNKVELQHVLLFSLRQKSPTRVQDSSGRLKTCQGQRAFTTPARLTQISTINAMFDTDVTSLMLKINKHQGDRLDLPALRRAVARRCARRRASYDGVKTVLAVTAFRLPPRTNPSRPDLVPGSRVLFDLTPL